ncbi:unnamed protein product [Cylicocyclus nassatus]|uniref:Uncharacterized protein n=1 Tax=Cylicocyclus nassatus TaxID=53992 RepID=A0AA36GMT6_CYLNA|nr:unnamed protein product [Cylicocyclus nassatus]
MYSDDDYIPQYCVLDSQLDKENDSRTTGSSQSTGKGSQHRLLSEPCALANVLPASLALNPVVLSYLELDPKPKTKKTIAQRKSVESRQEIGSEQSRGCSRNQHFSCPGDQYLLRGLDAITAENTLSLAKLGKSLRQFDINVENNLRKVYFCTNIFS